MNEQQDETYHGWTNYVTFSVFTWLTGEPERTQRLHLIVQRPQTRSVRGDALKHYTEEVFKLPTTGLAADLVNYALQSVDWQEIIRTCEEDAT